MVIFAEEGFAFAADAKGDDPVTDEAKKSGTHGHRRTLAAFACHVCPPWGAGIKAGVNLGEIRNIDVAPTVASLLGIPMPGVEGLAA